MLNHTTAEISSSYNFFLNRISRSHFNMVFGLRNKLVYYLLTSYFFVWFVEMNELIYYHLIHYS
jgi:hypothetical protein